MSGVGEYTNREAGEILEDEGIEYAVRHYCDGSYFKDETTGKLWDASAKSLNALVKHLHDSGVDIN